MVQTTSVHLQLQQGLARVFVCFLKTKQEQRLRANETISSHDVSLGSGKNGSFDDRTEGSSLHEGNRWLLLLMMMVSVVRRMASGHCPQMMVKRTKMTSTTESSFRAKTLRMMI